MNPVVSRAGPSETTRVVTFDRGVPSVREDRVAGEEPLEIRLRAGGASKTIAITMRTPGNDFELAAGFLHNEGVLANYDALRGISFCIDRDVDPEQRYNIVNVDLAAHELPELDTLERHFTTTSACGVCGKANLDALRMRGVEPVASDAQVDAATILALPDRLRAAGFHDVDVEVLGGRQRWRAACSARQVMSSVTKSSGGRTGWNSSSAVWQPADARLHHFAAAALGRYPRRRARGRSGRLRCADDSGTRA